MKEESKEEPKEDGKEEMKQDDKGNEEEGRVNITVELADTDNQPKPDEAESPTKVDDIDKKDE